MENDIKDEEIKKALTQFQVQALEEKPIQNQNAQPNFAKPSKLVEWVISHSGGMIKEQKQAEYVLLAFVVVVIIITIFIFVSGSSKNNAELEHAPDQSQFIQ